MNRPCSVVVALLRLSFLMMMATPTANPACADSPNPVMWVSQAGSGSMTGSDKQNAAPWPSVRTSLQSNTEYRFVGDIYGGMPVEQTSLTNVVFDGGSASGQVARFRNDLPVDIAELVDEGGGVFSFPLSDRPPGLVWSYQQDDASGTSTGITFKDAEIIAAFRDRPVAVAPRFAAWFGHLHPTEQTPAELEPGEWTFSDGRVFVQPPTLSTLEEVAHELRVIGADRGVYFKSSDGITIRNLDFVGFGNPGGQTGAVYTSGCTSIHLKNIIAYDSGYRAFNLEGDTGSTDPLGILIEDCIAAGDTVVDGSLSNNPFVVYNQTGCFDCGVRIEGGGIAAYPWLDFAGKPLLGDPLGFDTPLAVGYKPAGFYSHSGLGSVGVGGFEFERFFVVSFSQLLNEKHDLGMSWAAEGIGRLNRAELAVPLEAADPNDYPVRFSDSVFVCNPGLVQHILFDRCRFVTPRPRGGLPSYAGRISSWFPAPENNTALYFRSCEIILRELNASADNGLFKLIGSGNSLWMDLCTVLEITSAGQFRSDSLIRTVDGATIRLRGCVFATTREDGLNQHFLYRPGGAAVQVDYDPVAWAGLRVESCWFHNMSSPRMNERFGAGAVAGLTYPEFLDANVQGGAVKDFVTGVFQFGIDPEFESPDDGNLCLSYDSPLFSLKHPLIPELIAVTDFYGTPYSGRYGAVQAAGSACPGDANADGDINLADLNIVLANFGTETDEGDLDGDGQVDLADLNIVLATFGSSCAD